MFLLDGIGEVPEENVKASFQLEGFELLIH